MDQAIGIAHGIKPKDLPAQCDSLFDMPAEEIDVDGFVWIGGEDAQGDARMAVIEAAAYPLPAAFNDVDDAAAGQALAGLLHHLLKDPRVRGAASDLEADLRQLER